MSDVTGRSLIARNIVVSWGVQVFVLVAGFIVPRQISDHLGSDALGVWDLGWATFRYLTLTSLGSAAALNRFAALYHTSGKDEDLSSTYTVVIMWQVVIVTFIIAIAAICTQSVPLFELDGDTDPNDLLFAFSLAVGLKMLGDPGGSLITAKHRWDIQDLINTSQDVGIAVVLIASLFLGAGLIHIAMVVVAVTAVTSIARFIVAKRMWPDLSVRRSAFRTGVAIEVLRFGLKSMANSAPQMIVLQTTAFVLASAAGPTALAVFSRSMSLVNIIERLTKKVSMMFTPITSSLIGLEREDEVRQFLLDSCQFCMCIALPFAIFLCGVGDFIVAIWMGEDYVNWVMLCILAMGMVLPLANSGTLGVLAGMNAHGKIGLVSVFVALSLTLGCLYGFHITTGIDVIAAAMSVAIAGSVARGVVFPVFLKLRFGISLTAYLGRAVLLPLVLNVPFIAGCAGARYYLLDSVWLVGGGFFVLGGLATVALYWLYLLPDSFKEQCQRLIGRFLPQS